MATAFGCAEFPALDGLAARAKELTALRSVQTAFASQITYAPPALRLPAHASAAGPQDRPPRAPVLHSRRDPAARGVAVTCRHATCGSPPLLAAKLRMGG